LVKDPSLEGGPEACSPSLGVPNTKKKKNPPEKIQKARSFSPPSLTVKRGKKKRTSLSSAFVRLEEEGREPKKEGACAALRHFPPRVGRANCLPSWRIDGREACEKKASLANEKTEGHRLVFFEIDKEGKRGENHHPDLNIVHSLRQETKKSWAPKKKFRPLAGGQMVRKESIVSPLSPVGESEKNTGE